MRTRHVIFSLMAIVAVTCFIFISGCYETGNDEGSNAAGNAEGSTEIRGAVTQVVEAMRRTAAPPSTFAQLREFFTLARTAHAQTQGVAGITVSAQLDGVTLDTDETDAAGNFVLRVDEGPLELIFTTDSFTVTLDLTAVSDAVITLEVSLHPSQETEVVVELMDTAQNLPEGVVNCEQGTKIIEAEQIDGAQADIEIDGHGEVCIRAQNGCRIQTQDGMTANIVMTNCQDCIRAEGESEISLITTGSIICADASEDGVRAESGSLIELAAGHAETIAAVATAGAAIDISAAQDGVRAEGSASAVLKVKGTGFDDPEPLISVFGGNAGARAAGASSIHLSITDGFDALLVDFGDIVIEGGDTGIRAEGTAKVSVSAEICTATGANETIHVEGAANIDTLCVSAPGF